MPTLSVVAVPVLAQANGPSRTKMAVLLSRQQLVQAAQTHVSQSVTS